MLTGNEFKLDIAPTAEEVSNSHRRSSRWCVYAIAAVRAARESDGCPLDMDKHPHNVRFELSRCYLWGDDPGRWFQAHVPSDASEWLAEFDEDGPDFMDRPPPPVSLIFREVVQGGMS